MDQRHSAENPGQPRQAMPQRRVYVYDRPFADIRPPASAQQPPRPQTTFTPAPSPQHVAQPSVQQHVPAPRTSIDGFVTPAQRAPRQVTPQPFRLQQPTADFQPQQQQFTQQPQQPQQPMYAAPPQQQGYQAMPEEVPPATENEWRMQLPDDLHEEHRPINTPANPPHTNGNWRPLQQAAMPQPAHMPAVQSASWPQPAQTSPVNFEAQLQQNARQARKRPGVFKAILAKGIKVMAVLLLIGGAIFAINMVRTNQATRNAAGNFNQAEADDLGIFNTQPSEEQSSGTLGISKSIDAPKAVKIDAIDLAARVVAVGTSRNSYIKAPASIYDLGWYEGSAKPGQQGVVLLHGHISGPTRPGALYEIALLKRGAIISVERGDGKIYNYTVQAVEFFENDQIDMSKMLTPYNPNRNGLNIMTAGGRYNTETKAYELRAAVYAVEDTN